ncbi:hypothetical protein BDQ17DRAFT_221039 [Cyathus striatus]|nr:hypothetical protein BDQ17DRAFT_221039 [Cyathus striatus]
MENDRSPPCMSSPSHEITLPLLVTSVERNTPVDLVVEPMTLQESIPLYAFPDTSITITTNEGQSSQITIWKKLCMYRPSALCTTSSSAQPLSSSSTVVTSNFNLVAGSRTVELPRETPAGTSTPAPVESTREPHSPNRTNAASEVTADIHNFLSACNPPMTHYLSHFLAVGCRSRQDIKAVSRFPEGVLEEFIDYITKGGDQRMTDTEKVVLKRWFREYLE